MPMYEYQCTECKKEVTAFQKMKEEPLKKCNSCGKETLKKIITGSTFVLKGRGWTHPGRLY